AAKAALSQTLTMEELMAQGEQVYLARCAACHQPNGAGLPGVFPSLIGSPLIKGPAQLHIDIVLNGKSGTAMQAFSSQLTATEIAAVVTYERNAWGNNSGDTVQAADVSSDTTTPATSVDTTPATPSAIPATSPATQAEVNQDTTSETQADDEVTKELTTAPLGDLAMNELLTM
ncbi:c-type cytochrome, partial [Shewanella sp. 0m-11]